MTAIPKVGLLLGTVAALTCGVTWGDGVGPSCPVLKTYRGAALRRVKLPLGGLGTGTVSLSGRGALVDWELQGAPRKGFVPTHDKWAPNFSIRCETEDGRTVGRLLEGPVDAADYEGAYGAWVPNAGYPRFKDCTFKTAYPFAAVELADPDFPVRPTLIAYNPLVPGDADASSMPVASLAWRVANPGAKSVKVSVAGTLVNMSGGKTARTAFAADGLRGVALDGDGGGNPSASRGGLALAVSETAGVVTTATDVRGPGWNVALDRFWRRFVAEGVVADQPEGSERPVAQVAVSFELKPGETREIPFVLSWWYPDRPTWTPQDCANPWNVSVPRGPFPVCDVVTNRYATLYGSARAAAADFFRRRQELALKTQLFVRGVLARRAPESVKEAALFNLSTLRSETCFRLADGTLMGWEGIGDGAGSCFGSCTHVWGYEHAVVDIWPDLARSMVDAFLDWGMDERGHMVFRLGLPLETRARCVRMQAAADGQMQVVIKAYEYWKRTGDDAWAKKQAAKVLKALQFAWIKNGWDGDQDGVMEGCQHNTMDVEYYGPNPQMEFLYLAALEAGARFAEAAGEAALAAKCRDLRARGAAWTEKNLFNGAYYEHKIVIPKDGVADGLQSGMGAKDPNNPDYQLGAGCLVDQLLGEFSAVSAGLPYGADAAHRKTTLKTILAKNRRGPGCGEEAFNCMRSFVFADETSLRMAWYPEGRLPRSPFPYYGETMTGFEYVVAALLAAEGEQAEAERVVKDIRDRYDGAKRNPFDEAECGHHYARALDAWSVLRLWH